MWGVEGARYGKIGVWGPKYREVGGPNMGGRGGNKIIVEELPSQARSAVAWYLRFSTIQNGFQSHNFLTNSYFKTIEAQSPL